jgi:hydroxyethylthiazole kinase-like uncharacterized protein yjeF
VILPKRKGRNMYLSSVERSRKLDKQAEDIGLPALLLMENAGRALADGAEGLCKRRCEGQELPEKYHRVLVLAGPGQNGGDGFVAARHLASRGYLVRVLFFGREDALPREAAANYRLLPGSCVEVLGAEADIESSLSWASQWQPGLIIDALLGTGVKGSPRPPMDRAIVWANSAGVPIVSCDLPSGLNADTGWPYPPTVRADLTVTMGLPKAGLYSYPGRAFCGEIVADSLGIPGTLLGVSEVRAVFAEDVMRVFPTREPDHHKGLSGHVTVIAGSVGMAGAGVLAATACLRAGAGTVTLLCPGGAYQVCASMVPEVMVVPVGTGRVFEPDGSALDKVAGFLRRSRSAVIGPGIGRGTPQEAFVAKVLGLGLRIPLVIDADALYALKALGGLTYLGSIEGSFILTPHPGELSYLLGVDMAEIAKDRLGSARRAALTAKAVVCLKGAGTCVANVTGEEFINTSGDPAMATAGSGDVLTGVIASLVAQGLSPIEASWAGVFWHGLAGERARAKVGSHGALAGDISRCLPEVRGLFSRR